MPCLRVRVEELEDLAVFVNVEMAVDVRAVERRQVAGFVADRPVDDDATGLGSVWMVDLRGALDCMCVAGHAYLPPIGRRTNSAQALFDASRRADAQLVGLVSSYARSALSIGTSR